jgi:polysaccharide export outer membrane protein
LKVVRTATIAYIAPVPWSECMLRSMIGLAARLAIAAATGSAAAQTTPPHPAPFPITLPKHAGEHPAASTIAAAPVSTVSKASPLSAREALSYRLGPGDKLHIITFDEPQLTGDFLVGADGMVSLPWIGDVPARGRTESELRADIEAKLKDGYILNPAVSLQVMTYRPFYILGEVNKPGEYPYTAGLTVMSAVATAGGFTYRADTHRVYIKHLGETAEIRTKAKSAGEVHAGDTIRIAERFF